jgi:hypothetical protein
MRTTLPLIVAFLLLTSSAQAAENMLKPTNKADSWRFEQHNDGKGTMTVDGDAIVFTVTTPGADAWNVQVFQVNLDLKAGKEYTVTFKAKADAPRSMNVWAGIDEEDWHNIGLDEAVELTKEFKEFKFTFTPSDVRANKNRIGFIIGGEKGKISVQDVKLVAK